jgi:hypothetical protein
VSTPDLLKAVLQCAGKAGSVQCYSVQCYIITTTLDPLASTVASTVTNNAQLERRLVMGVDSPGAAQRNIADDMHMDDDSPNKALHKKSRTQPATPTSAVDTYADDDMSPHTGALASAAEAEIAGTNMGQHTQPATGQPAQPEPTPPSSDPTATTAHADALAMSEVLRIEADMCDYQAPSTPYASQLQVQSAYHQHVEVHARVHGYPHVGRVGSWIRCHNEWVELAVKTHAAAMVKAGATEQTAQAWTAERGAVHAIEQARQKSALESYQAHFTQGGANKLTGVDEEHAHALLCAYAGVLHVTDGHTKRMLTEAEAARVADDLTRCHTLDTLLSMMGRRSMSQRVLYEAMEAAAQRIMQADLKAHSMLQQLDAAASDAAAAMATSATAFYGEEDDDSSDSDGNEETEDLMSPKHVPASPIGKWLKGPPPHSPSPRPGQKRTSERRLQQRGANAGTSSPQ